MSKNSLNINEKYSPLFQKDGIKTRYVLVTGGRGSGKSFGSTTAMALKMYDPGHIMLYTRFTMDSAEDSVIPEFKEKLDLLNIEEDFAIQRKNIFCKGSKSKILFRGVKTSSGSQTAKLKSIQGITVFVVDEGEEMPEKDFNTIDQGIRSKGAQNIVLIIMNPADTTHWVYQRFIKDSHRIEMHDGYPVPISTHPDVTHIHTTYLDNIENLDETYVKSVILRMKFEDPDQYAAKVIGIWADIKTGLEAYFNYSVGKHLRDLPFKKQLAVNASFDQNVVPYAYTSLWQILYDEDKVTLYCYDEIVGRPPNHHTGTTCKEIKRRHNRMGMAGFNYYGDASGNKRDNRSKTTDYRIVEGQMQAFTDDRSNRTWRNNPNVKRRLEFINLILGGAFENIEILIHPRCTVMQTDLAKIKVDANGNKAKEMDTVAGVRFQKYGHCFIAGTKITTNQGEKNIEDIQVGDMVLTRFGYRKVLGAGMTQENAMVRTYEIAGKIITCTPDHKIWTKEGFKKVKLLTGQNIFCTFDGKKICLIKSNTKELTSTDTQTVQTYLTKDITKDGVQFMVKERKSIYTDIYGSKPMVIYRMGTTFIIKMKIIITMILETLNCFLIQNIQKDIGIAWETTRNNVNEKFLLKKQSPWLQSGTGVKKAENGIVPWLKKQLKKIKESAFVKNVETNLSTVQPIHCIAPGVANQDIEQGLTEKAENGMKTELVQPATPFFQSINGTRRPIVQESAAMANVYDLSVEEHPEYFANGILVHNSSDTLDYIVIKALEMEWIKFLKSKSKRVKIYN